MSVQSPSSFPSLSDMLGDFVKNKNSIKESNTAANKWMYQDDHNVKENKEALKVPQSPVLIEQEEEDGLSDILVEDVYPPGFPDEESVLASSFKTTPGDTCPSNCRCICQEQQQQQQQLFSWPQSASFNLDRIDSPSSTSKVTVTRPSAEVAVALFPCARSAAYQLALALKLCRRGSE